MNDEETSNGTSTKITEGGHCVEKVLQTMKADIKRNPIINIDGLRYINTRNKNLKII